MFYWLPILVFFGSLCWSPAVSHVIQKRAASYIANETMCIVDKVVYRNGDPVPTDDECERCTCRPPGFSCVLRDCDTKPGCKAVRKAGECCPEYICGCVLNDRYYEDGEIVKHLQNNCYTCRCYRGSISCTFADCHFRGDCPPEYTSGGCCPIYDHCPPLSTTTTTTTTTTVAPIVQQEIEFINMTTQHIEKFVTEGSTVTVEYVETTPSSDLFSAKFTLSGEKISSIQDYDATELTTLLSPQTGTYKETTKHIVFPPGTELTSLKDGLIVENFDRTTTESLSQSTIRPEIFGYATENHTTSEVLSTLDDTVTTARTKTSEFETFDSGSEISTTKVTTISEGESGLSTSTGESTELSLPVNVTADSEQSNETTEHDEMTDGSETHDASEFTDNDLHASSNEVHTVTATLSSATTESTELDSDSPHKLDNQTEFIQKSTSDQSSTTPQSQTPDSEYETGRGTETTKLGAEPQTSTYDELPSSTDISQSVTTASTKFSTHDETDVMDIQTKSTDYQTTFGTSGISDSSDTPPEITSHRGGESGDIEISQNIVSTEMSSTLSASDIESTSSHDESETEYTTDIALSSTEIVSDIHVSAITAKEDAVSDNDIETTVSQHSSVHSLEELDSLGLNTSPHDYESTATDTYHPTDNFQTHETSDASDESTPSSQSSASLDLSKIATRDTISISESTQSSSFPHTDSTISESLDVSTSYIKFGTTETEKSLDSTVKVSHQDAESSEDFTPSEITKSEELLPSTTIASSETVSNLISSSESEEADAENQEVTTEIFATEATEKTEILHSEDSEINISTKIFDEVETSPKTIRTNDTEIDKGTTSLEVSTNEIIQGKDALEVTTEKSVKEIIKPAVVYEESKSTYTEESTTYIVSESGDLELEVSTLKDLISLIDVDTKEIVTSTQQSESETNIFKLSNETEISIKEGEMSTNKEHTVLQIGETVSYTEESFHITTERQTTIGKEYDSNPTFISTSSTIEETFSQTNTEENKNDVTVHLIDDKLVTTPDATSTQSPVPEKITSLKPHTEKLPTISETDLPSEMPAFEPPMANILKQQVLFNRRTTEKKPTTTSVPFDDTQNSQSNFANDTTNENNIAKLSLTLEETDESIGNTSSISNDSDDGIFVLNHEYTIPDSEMISFDKSNHSIGKDDPEEMEGSIHSDENRLQSGVISNSDVMDSEYLYSETGDKEDDTASKDSNLLSDPLEEHSLSAEQNLPRSNQSTENTLVNNFFMDNFTNDSQENDDKHKTQEVGNGLKFSTPINKNDDDSTNAVENEISTQFSIDISDEALNQNLSSFDSKDLLENHNGIDNLDENPNETDLEYQDAENVEIAYEKGIPTTISADESNLEDVTDHSPSSNELASITEDNDKASSTTDDIKEQSTTVKINILFGQDSLDSLKNYNEPDVHPSITIEEDNSNVNSHSLDLNTEFLTSTKEPGNIQDSGTDSDFYEKQPDLTTHSSSNLNSSNLTDEDASYSSSNSEDSISTTENSSSSITILEYLGDLFSTISTMTDVDNSITTQNNPEFSEGKTELKSTSVADAILTTENSSLSSEQSYSSRLKDQFAEFGSLGGVFITGQSKYNKSSLNVDTQNSEKDAFSNNTSEDVGSNNSDEIARNSINQTTLGIDMSGEEHYSTIVSEPHVKEFTETELQTTKQIESDGEKAENGEFISTTVLSSNVDEELENITDQGIIKVTPKEEKSPASNISEEARVDSENTDDSLLAKTEIKQEGGPEKGGEWFEPTDPALPLANSINTQNVSNATIVSVDEGLDLTAETNVNHGPEKGGEVFEPSFPEVFPINSAVKEDKIESNENGESVAKNVTEIAQDVVLSENTTFSESSSNKSEAIPETDTDSVIVERREFVPPIPILLKDLNKHGQRNNDNSIEESGNTNKTKNPADDYVLDEGSTTISSKLPSGKSFDHPYHLSDIIDRVFKAPGYDTEVEIRPLKGFANLKKSKILRLKRNVERFPEVKPLSDAEIANSNSPTLSNRNPADSPGYPVNDKNIMLVEGYGYKPSGFFPVTSSFIIVVADEDSDENDTEVDPKRKATSQPKESISEAELLDEISNENSGMKQSHPMK